MRDYWLDNPDALQGTPKKTIAEYVKRESEILVPTIYEGFEEAKQARKARKKVIGRSEHNLEYTVSDILYTGQLDSFSKLKDEAALIKKEHTRSLKNFEDNDFPDTWQVFCKLMDIDMDEFAKEISISYWEYLPGHNLTVVADSAIKGRYHLMMSIEGKKDNRPSAAYYLLDGEDVKMLGGNNEFHEIIDMKKTIINTYETVRNLPRFDSENCPIIEMQENKGKLYFLQYLKTQNFNPPNFSTSLPKGDGWIPLDYVRGHIGPNPTKAILTFHHTGFEELKHHEFPLTDDADGNFDISLNCAFDEIMSSRRAIQGLDNWSDEGELIRLLEAVATYHEPRSLLFKPKFSFITKSEYLISQTKEREMQEQGAAEKKHVQVEIEIISDGNVGYIRPIRTMLTTPSS